MGKFVFECMFDVENFVDVIWFVDLMLVLFGFSGLIMIDEV